MGARMAKSVKKFKVSAMVKVWTEIDVVAETLDEALEKSKTLVYDDFVTPTGDLNDVTWNIVSVSDHDALGF